MLKTPMLKTLNRFLPVGNDSVTDSHNGREMDNSPNDGGAELLDWMDRSRAAESSTGLWQRARSFITRPSTSHLAFSILAIILLCVSSVMQMSYKVEKCPLLVPSENRAFKSPNICCQCICEAVNGSCTNAVGAGVNSVTNPHQKVTFYSNYMMGGASLIAYGIAFWQIYFAKKEENTFLSISIVLVFIVQLVRNVFWFIVHDYTTKDWYSSEAIAFMVPLVLAGVCTVVTAVLFRRSYKHFGAILYQRKCVTATRQRLFVAYQFVNAMQWLEFQLVVGGFVLLICTNHNTETPASLQLLLSTVGLFLGDIIANFVVISSLRKENKMPALVAIIMKLLSAVTWFFMAEHYRHCYDNFLTLGHYVRDIYSHQDRYLWPKAMGTDDSVVAFIDRAMRDCISPRTVNSFDLPFVMATIFVAIAVVRCVSCLVFGWLICFFTKEGEIWEMFSKSNPEVARQDAVVELE